LEPIAYGGAEGGQLRELVFYNPRGTTFEVIEKAGDGPVSFVLLHDLTEIPVPVLKTLCFEDSVLAARMAAGVLQKKYGSTTERAAELGIRLPKLPTLEEALADLEAEEPEAVEDE
jgi:hypothetical protein